MTNVFGQPERATRAATMASITNSSWRCPNPNSNRNRSNSFVFRMDILLAGTLFSLFMEFLCRVIVQRRYGILRLVLWKTFRSKPNTIPVDEQNCSPSRRNRVHLQAGMLFGITTECCSASDRNRVHLRPDSPSFQSDPAVVDGKSQQCPILFPKESFRIFQCLTNDLCVFGLERNAMNSKNGLRVGRTLPISSKAGTGGSL